ncbi:hypothetical protein R1sor_017293 [Riccia sorocarpa]|uniref:Endoglucanase n=1 Tax=Riccia sorocarpa TaxID=122646 RepID=A0ABD3I7H9_9MARC
MGCSIMGQKCFTLTVFLISWCSSLFLQKSLAQDYAQALDLSFQYFEAQRSGPLPSNQRVTWRADSALEDGKAQGIDLVGGYFDAGDNVKFQFPMAYTITTLAWGVIEYRSQLEQLGQLQYALDAIKWGTDYFIKAHPEPNVLWAEVGDGVTDHECWMRPEDMTTPRTGYKIDASNPGSEVAAETAAAMAAASIVFKDSDPDYSNTLVTHATQLFNFADRFRANYDVSIPVVKNFYASLSGYNDELLWAAMWLLEATSEPYYQNYVVQNAVALGGLAGTGSIDLNWDSKYSGVHVLASKILLEGRTGLNTDAFKAYQTQAESTMCSALGLSGTPMKRTSGGLFHFQDWNNLHCVTGASFLITAYSDYLARNNQTLTCSGQLVQPSELLALAQQQVDYILGTNPKNLSYMVGYGTSYPQFPHHRGASIVSIKTDSAFVACDAGYEEWYQRPEPNPNVLTGAVVGGPDQDDNYTDERDNVQGGESATYNSGPIVGVLARLAGSSLSSTSSESELSEAVIHPNESTSIYAQQDQQIRGESDEFDLKLDIHQELVSKWRRGKGMFFKVQCTVTNHNEHAVKKLILTSNELKGPVIGLHRLRGRKNSFTLPKKLKALQPGESFTFTYVSVEAVKAKISVKQALLE